MTEDNEQLQQLRKDVDELKTQLLRVKDGKRGDMDLDSIEVGTPAKGGGCKIYFNWRTDDIKDIMLKVKEMLEAASKAQYLKEQGATQ